MNSGETEPAKPSPGAEGVAQHYWEGTSRGALMLQRCSRCGALRHYPQLLCTACFSDAYDWVEATGRGRVHSWTVTHHAFHPAFAGDLPYVLVTVDLDEGARALGRLAGLPPERLAIDLPVRAQFVPRADGFGELTFEPA